MYLWTTKDCLAELLFSALFQGENGMQSEQANIPERTVTIRGCAVSGSEGSLPHDLEPNTLGIPGPMQQQQGWCVGYHHMSRRWLYFKGQATMSQCDSSGEIIRIKLTCSKLTMMYLEIPSHLICFWDRSDLPTLLSFWSPSNTNNVSKHWLWKEAFKTFKTCLEIWWPWRENGWQRGFWMEAAKGKWRGRFWEKCVQGASFWSWDLEVGGAQEPRPYLLWEGGRGKPVCCQ